MPACLLQSRTTSGIVPAARPYPQELQDLGPIAEMWADFLQPLKACASAAGVQHRTCSVTCPLPCVGFVRV